MLRLAAVVLCETLLYTVLNRHNPALGALLRVAALALLAFTVLDDVREIFAFFSSLLTAADAPAYLGVLGKILVTALAFQLAADTAKESGQLALATQVEFVGGVLILTLALPLLKGVLQLLSGLMEGT